MLVHTLEMQSVDEFSFDAPKGYGPIIITGFIDEAGDGPSASDPQGRLSIDIGEESQIDLKIQVKSDNAPVQPKPPSDKPDDKSGSDANNKAPTEKGSEKPAATPPAEAPPADDAPPADE